MFQTILLLRILKTNINKPNQIYVYGSPTYLFTHVLPINHKYTGPVVGCNSSDFLQVL